MSSKSTAEIRQAFLNFFHTKGHEVVPSSSLVPNNDPTLLFTNAGMNQFKDVFLGLDKRAYSRATTAQRCVRAGGKHNDLENVGYTAHHHTFFEMLGNFSFGDYFKQDAIKYAWELLTSEQWFNLPKERLWITVYHTDEEAYNIWQQEIGIPAERIIRIGDNKGAPYASDNFWQMGDTGPCGPCTEIFYDHGEHMRGGPPGSPEEPEEDGDRYIEIWNIVFMQFNRQSDGSLKALPTPSVDTGMGLERIAAVLQHVNSNYEIDLFRQLITAIAKVIALSDLNNKSLRVIADHIRSSAFLIGDGVFPANEGRGYVLRRIIRRAVRHGYMLGAKETFFYKLVAPLIQVMGNAADELKSQQATIEKTLKNEEEQFARTLARGLQLLDDELAQLQGDTLAGEIAFRLYDTYGFPFDLTADVCRERNIKVDELGFNAAMEQQRDRARESSGFATDYNDVIQVDSHSDFSGYENNNQQAAVTAIFHYGKPVNVLNQGEEGIIILDKTSFYAESGGQVGDSGILSNSHCQFAVSDTQKYAQAIGHIGKVMTGSIAINNLVDARIDIERRNAIRLNHSATHLLHAALRDVLGNHVSQKGSLVNEKYLRFDFSYFAAMTPMQIRQIEDIVNYQIRKNEPIITTLIDLEAAKEKGAMALFGEKYDAQVRVLSIGDFSIELCGGTHANRTGDIGLFRISSESGTAAGIRRIEAITGQVAIDDLHQQSNLLAEIGQLMKGDANNLMEKIKTALDKVKLLERSLDQLKGQQAAQESVSLSQQVKKINGVNLLVTQLNNTEPKQLRIIVDDLKNQLKSAIIVLSTISNDKVSLIVGVTNDLTVKIKAGDLISFVAQQVGGKGGGRPDMAQAGGSNITALPAALASVEEWVNSRLT
ncbi:Alanine--tRNA ligase [Arsenophonus endosymbiont of Aleurodicus floccissimus]|uniref:alanine--tRNA ligase n=1 Tax=Arsenophonus endosymbiont of Aleurodicus floccissimus TaxID=2152761 RepID=UPI000E6B0F4A|nr:alanine--tRNA ligase [Arsenophonus endosymbiont of Aleurodicus floccissimus]SPP32512.1 Alanine--tRNA ligase [Arsenophonus endosymbiont of Aleurodicus floccissimus]